MLDCLELLCLLLLLEPFDCFFGGYYYILGKFVILALIVYGGK